MKAAGFCVFLSAGLVLGCGSAFPARAAETIVIDGSTGGIPMANALAKAFRELNPGVSIEIGKGLGTKARIQALAERKIDIALASHGLDIGDITRQSMTVHEIANVAVIFAVNASVPLTTLTSEQICGLYAGKTTNWSTLGGPRMPIEARARPDSEVDSEVVRDKVACLKELKLPDTVKIMPRAGDMAAELAATPGAIGVTSMTVVEQSQGRIKALALNGTEPSAQNVERKNYLLVRESYLVVRTPAALAVAQFLEFIRGLAGQSVIAANGAVAVK